MKRLYVSVDEVHQVFSPKTGQMSTTLVLDVFGHPVEVPVTDSVIRGVIDAAVAQMGDPTVEPEPTAPYKPPLEDGPVDPTIPIPEAKVVAKKLVSARPPAPVIHPTDRFVDMDDDGFEAG